MVELGTTMGCDNGWKN